MAARQHDPRVPTSHLGFDRTLADLDHLADESTDELRTRVTHLVRLVEQVEWAMVARASIEQAKGVLMAAHRIDADAAFEMLRRQSQLSNTKLAEVARTVLITHTGETRP